MTDRTALRKKPTLKDLAELTGLSPAGAHYALRGERVSPETVARVRDEARRIGFRSDPVARSLRGGASGLVGVVGGSLHDYWHLHFASELGRRLRDDGRQMLLADAGGDHRTQVEAAARLLDHRVDGLVVLPVDPLSADWREIVERVPTVSVGASPLPPPSGSVRFGAPAGIRLMLEHLRGLGRRSVLVLSPGIHSLPATDGVSVVECGFSTADAAAAAERALDAEIRPTAIFCLTDAIAYGVYAACRRRDLSIPEDISVAGFDDHPLSELLHPALTTVEWDTPRAAATAARVLDRAFADGGARGLGRVSARAGAPGVNGARVKRSKLIPR